jgi:hypothetical protein
MTEWKPEKNVSSPWDVDTWENNIGQPVKPSGDNLPYPYTSSYIYNGEWYDVDTTKITSIKDVKALFDAIGLKVSESNENFDKVKHLLIVPEQPKTLDEITQEFDEKIDNLIEITKGQFEYSKIYAEKEYDYKFDKIIGNFEYAKEHGQFPYLKLAYTTTGLSAGSYVETNFVIKQGSNHKGYYTMGNQRYFRYYMPDKPNRLVKFFMKTCLGLVLVDE